MERKEFYIKIEQNIQNHTKQELIEFIDNIIRKIPNSKLEEVLYISNKTEYALQEENIKNKIEAIKRNYKKSKTENYIFMSEHMKIILMDGMIGK